MKKAIPSIYYIFLAIAILITIAAWIGASTDQFDLSAAQQRTQMEPTDVKQMTEDTREFSFHVGEIDDTNSCMSFFSTHQNIRVWIDGELVYEVMAPDSIFGKTTGGRWNFVEIPNGAQQITIELKALLSQVGQRQMYFYQGNAIIMYSDLLKDSVLEVIVSILNIAVGMVLIGYWIIVRRKMKVGQDILYFGIVAFLLGCWTVNEADITTLLIKNRVACVWVAYMTLMLIVPPFILFIKNFLEVEEEVWTNSFCVACYVNIGVSVALQMLGVLAFKQTIIATHILMCLSLVYTIIALAGRIKTNGMDRKVKLTVIGIVMLAVSLLVDLVAYYQAWQNTDVVGRFAMLAFIGMFGYESTAESLEKVDEGRKAEIYRELAIKDMLTGLYNRNAYDEWSTMHGRKQGTMLVMFDLNNLKECNDTLGHAMGDFYIKSAAEIIQKVFRNDGTCFRIGGDEFCVVIEDGQHVDVDERIRVLHRLEAEFNHASELLKIETAHGYAVFDEKKDKNIEDTRKRADEKMYNDKRLGKALEQSS